MANAQPLLSVRGVSKAFLGVSALENVDFTLQPGEVHALLGENGAGKSTLIKIITGAYRRDEGEVLLEGAPIYPRDVVDAQKLGIGTVYQEVNLLTNLTVAENLFLGRQPKRFGLTDVREMNRRSRAILDTYGLQIDVTTPLANFSVAIQQVIAIARAVDISGKVLVLDEPTASLDAHEVEMLFTVVRQLRARGMGIIFISHFLDQVYEIADTITVLRNGRLIDTVPVAGLNRLKLVSMMLGRQLESDIKRTIDPNTVQSEPLVSLRGLGKRGNIDPLDLDIRQGEVVGIAGLLGSGRTETAQLVFGIERADSGTISVAGTPVNMSSPRKAIALGFAFCPEDRKTDGIISDLSVRENIIFALQAQRGWMRPLSRSEQEALADRYIAALDIRTSDREKPIKFLSGGNQQKVLLARWLATNPRFLILDEPTRGIDVGAHAEIIRLIIDLCERGMALLVISSELGELVGYSSRIIVLRDRKMVSELTGDEISTDHIMKAIASHGATGEGSVMAVPTIVRERTPQLIVLAAILALNAIISPGFFSIEIQNDRLYGSLIDVLNRGAPVTLLAIGMTLVIATKGIDLSVGAVMAIVGAVAASLITSGYSLPATLAGSLFVGLICGLWNGALVALLDIQPIIATLILMVAGRGIAQLITEGVILTFNDKPGLIFVGSGSFLSLPMPVIIWIIVAILAILVVRRSALGLLIEAIGVNRRASTLSGVNSRVILLAVYAVSGFCAAIAGVIAAADIKGADANNAGLWLEMDAILAVVIGGTSLLGGRFSLVGSLMGAMIIQSLNTGILLAGFPPEFNLIIKAAIILIILIVQSPASQAAMANFRANRQVTAVKTESREHAAR